MALILPVAGFNTTITSRITSTEDTIPLDSVVDDEGNNLSGTKGFIIDEGTPSEEFVIGTVDAANSRLTSSLRGISVVDGSTEVPALRHEHRKKAPIKISDHPYLVLALRVLNGTDSLDPAAIMKYSAEPSFSSGSHQLATVKFAEDQANAGAANASTVQKGIAEEATQAEIAAGTAAGATSARLFTNPSTLAAHIQSGTWISGSTAGTASAITATCTPTLTALTHNMMLVLHNTTACNAGATLNVDGLGAKAIYKYAGGSAIAVEANDMKAAYHHILIYDSDATVWLLVNPVYGTLTQTIQTNTQTAMTGTNVTGTELETLTTGNTSDASQLHKHAVALKRLTYDMSTASGSSTVAHGLGVTPRYVKVSAYSAIGVAVKSWSIGSYDGTTTQSNTIDLSGSAAETSASYAVKVGRLDTANYQTATIAFDGTNVTFTWTKTGTPTGLAYLFIEVFA